MPKGAFLLTMLMVTLLTPSAWAQSCRQSIGAARAQELARQCLRVSPASHPPCNIENPCDMMKEEVARGCGMYPGTKPAFCPDPAGAPANSATRYACPAFLDGHKILNWNVKDTVGNGRVDDSSGTQSTPVWTLTAAQAARGSVRIVCGYNGTARVAEIPVRAGLKRCINPEMTAAFDCN
jgi:hypothetical protein